MHNTKCYQKKDMITAMELMHNTLCQLAIIVVRGPEYRSIHLYDPQGSFVIRHKQGKKGARAELPG